MQLRSELSVTLDIFCAVRERLLATAGVGGSGTAASGLPFSLRAAERVSGAI